MSGPVIEIDWRKIRHNARVLSDLYRRKGVEIMGVTKAVLGLPAVAQAFVSGGIETLADSRLENIRRMREAGVESRFVLLRTPRSEAEAVVRWADASLNSELSTLEALSQAAVAAGRRHGVLLMVEMGDLREGVPAADFHDFFAAATRLRGLDVLGIGCNLACYGGVAPDEEKMASLSRLAAELEGAFARRLPIVSGGNSANHAWLVSAATRARINNLRLGELILLGRETLERRPVPDLHTDAFVLTAEVIEANVKPSLPQGSRGEDAFGRRPAFADRGPVSRAIVALGEQDVRVSGLRPRGEATVLGASSDHVILATGSRRLQVGEEVAFDLDYAALLSAMTSPFVAKRVIGAGPAGPGVEGQFAGPLPGA